MMILLAQVLVLTINMKQRYINLIHNHTKLETQREVILYLSQQLSFQAQEIILTTEVLDKKRRELSYKEKAKKNTMTTLDQDLMINKISL
jgi:hypothetical protein